MCVVIIGIKEDGETSGSVENGSLGGVVAGMMEDRESVGWVRVSDSTVDGAPLGKSNKIILKGNKIDIFELILCTYK